MQIDFSTFGENAGLIAEQYELYKRDPDLVEPNWRSFFEGLGYQVPQSSFDANGSNGVHAQSVQSSEQTGDLVGVRLVDAYRRSGHLAARINPLSSVTSLPSPRELDPSLYGQDADPSLTPCSSKVMAGFSGKTLADLISILERMYCSSVGFEYMHIPSYDEREWLRSKIESEYPGSTGLNGEEQKRVLRKLVEGELFESELHKKYVGTKRFSIEGGETTIAVLDAILRSGAAAGVEEMVFGMAHRGRLNILSNILGKPLEEIFREFDDQSAAVVLGAGDVKYHLGYENDLTVDGKKLKVSMVPNPSHLEFVNPVVEGVVRAIQDSEHRQRSAVLPILLHGDSAFAGQGVVFETINFSGLPGYTTGGTFHIVINNQIGFTTTPDEARSSSYCTDLAKGIGSPIFHVNCEDVASAIWVAKVALEYRQRFGKDVFVDLYCYRKYGHNEGDDPSFTQPLIYSEIKSKKPVYMLFGEQLVSDSKLTKEELDSEVSRYRQLFTEAQERKAPEIGGEACAMYGRLRIPAPETGVSKDRLEKIAKTLTSFPQNFTPHPKVQKIQEKRVEAVEKEEGIEWGLAEALAFGSLVLEGRTVRLSGQDCARGTFSQRHLVLDDYKQLSTWSPFSLLQQNGARFEVFNSSLSEAAVLGFEFGYSATDRHSLVIWEAQFGDFANGAQVIIDQFIAGSEAKWSQLSGVTMMLPHGYEGQGPEHSSARLERFLQLSGEGNMVVCYPSTAAQHFHLLRRQGLLELKRPLVIMTPKSLLRLPSAMSPLTELTSGQFKTVIDEEVGSGGGDNVVLMTGKIYHDIKPALEKAGVAAKIVRVEQLHPFPQFEFKKALKDRTPKKVIWVQEEPENMGAWSYVQPYLANKLGLNPMYVGRPAGASTATGSAKRHAKEQTVIVEEVIAALKA